MQRTGNGCGLWAFLSLGSPVVDPGSARTLKGGFYKCRKKRCELLLHGRRLGDYVFIVAIDRFSGREKGEPCEVVLNREEFRDQRSRYKPCCRRPGEFRLPRRPPLNPFVCVSTLSMAFAGPAPSHAVHV